MKNAFYRRLKTSSAIASIVRSRYVADMLTASYMAAYWRWLNARPHIHQARGSNWADMPETPSFDVTLVMARRGLSYVERSFQTSRFRHIADSFGLTPFPTYFLAS
jgi:hypothetical protein